jgi:benzoate/toluate 1,2-dioxygenase alpha subunit
MVETVSRHNGALAAGAAQELAALVQEDRVHRRVYTEPGIFELELERIFGRTWVFVGHASEVAQPGDYTTTRLGRQPVILTRDPEGALHVLFNRCPHRGAVVCREERGTSGRFRCIYHGWTFNNRGQLMGVPYREGYGDDFRMDDYALAAVPRVEVYRGFVFACLRADVEPLESYLGRAKQYLDLIVDRAPEGEIEVTKGVQKYAFHGNWKLQLENFVDSYHPAFTHESAFERFYQRTGRPGGRGDEGAENVYLGNGHSMIDYSAGPGGENRVRAQVDAAHVARLQERLGPEQAERVLTRGAMNLAIFPNLLFHSPRQHYRVVRPVAVDYTEVYAYPYRLKGAAEEENARQVRGVAIWAGAAGLGQPDDIEAFDRVQEGLGIPSLEWVLFHRGRQRERVEPSGEVRGRGADEVAQRGQHREYKRLMLQE